MSSRIAWLLLPLLFLLNAYRIAPPSGTAAGYPYASLPPKGEAYVRLKNGDTVTGNVILKQPFLQHPFVEVDGKTYKQSDVSFFQDSKARYANAGGDGFIPQVAEGTINLFRSIDVFASPPTGAVLLSSPSSIAYGSNVGMSRTRTVVHDYMQNGTARKVVPFNYANLRQAIPSRSAASEHLDTYLHKQRTARIVGYAGLGALVGGLILAGSNLSVNTDGIARNPGLTTGTTMILLGVPAICFSSVKGALKRRYLYKALDAYNAEGTRARRRASKVAR